MSTTNGTKPTTLGKAIFTTGQAAQVCNVAAHTVSKWVDEGQFPGAYRIPGSGDRRIPRAGLLAFLRSHRMPVPAELEEARWPILLVSVDGQVASHLQRALPESDGYAFTVADGAFDAGRHSVGKALAVIDFANIGRPLGLAIGVGLWRVLGDRVPLLALLPEDSSGGVDLVRAGYGLWFQQPVDLAWLVLAIRERLSGGQKRAEKKAE